MAINLDERAYPFVWNGQCTWGLTKREALSAWILAGIVQGFVARGTALDAIDYADAAKYAEKAVVALSKKL